MAQNPDGQTASVLHWLQKEVRGTVPQRVAPPTLVSH